MSSTNRSLNRVNEYGTPPECVRLLTARLSIDYGLSNRHRILEPQAGSGSILRALRDDTLFYDSHVTAIEVNPEHRGALSSVADKVIIHDFLDVEPPADLNKLFDLVIGNPPYGRPTFDTAGTVRLGTKGQPIQEDAVTDHVEHGLRMLKPDGLLVYLLRWAWIVPTVRSTLNRHPIHAYPLRKRPSFLLDGVPKGSDSTEYAWFVWGGTEVNVRFAAARASAPAAFLSTPI